MEGLALGHMAGSLPAYWLVVAGEGLAAGLAGAEWQSVWGEGAEVQESLLLSFRGSAQATRAVLAQLQALVAAQAAWEAGAGGRRLWLRALRQDGSGFAYSPVLSAELAGREGLRLGMLRGGFQLELRLRRENRFVGEASLAGLSNRLRNSSGGNLTLNNYEDSGHANSCALEAAGLMSELPMPLQARLRNQGSRPWAKVWLGLWQGAGSLPVLNLQAESGSGGSVVTSSLASGGKYAEIRFAGSSWQELLRFEVSSQNLQGLAGKAYLPFIRLVTGVNGRCWLRLVLEVGGAELSRGSETRLEAGARMAALGALNLPPRAVAVGSLPQPLYLVLEGLAGDAGERVLSADDLQLMPTEGLAWVEVAGGIPPGGYLDLDTLGEQAVLNASLQSSHANVLGEGLFADPAGSKHLVFLAADGNGAAALDLTASLSVWLRPAWRLP